MRMDLVNLGFSLTSYRLRYSPNVLYGIDFYFLPIHLKIG